MRTIITGATGQLGQALTRLLSQQNFNVLDFPRFDIADHSIVQHISNAYPELVIHCAAMTNVDGCAKDPDKAFSVNAFGSQNIAHACLRCGASMVYISTNEVFSGRTGQPYREEDKPQPINPYGSSKRSGEQMAAHYLKGQLYIVRIAWLYGGNHMFPEKIMAAADKNGALRVVTDEVSNPTYTVDLAEAIAQLVRTQEYGIYHLTNSGYCSRFEFATEILRLTGREHIPIQPITLAEYPRASMVPHFTPLENNNGAALGITLRPWQEALATYLAENGDG